MSSSQSPSTQVVSLVATLLLLFLLEVITPAPSPTAKLIAGALVIMDVLVTLCNKAT